MSSDQVSTLQYLMFNNYASLAIVITVTYDYFLMLPREIDYIWCKPWTWITANFILIRYLGLAWAILYALSGTSFLPGPPEVSSFYTTQFATSDNFWCIASSLTAAAAFAIFYNLADLIMILRVYAMWGRSKWILWMLLLFYIPQVIILIVDTAIFSIPNVHFFATMIEIQDYTFCGLSSGGAPPQLSLYDKIPRFGLSTSLVVLAVSQTWNQSVEMYRATGQWQPGRYLQQLVKDGALYFLAYTLVNIADVVEKEPTVSSTVLVYITVLSTAPTALLVPRFIIGMREIYENDLKQWSGLDSAFGVLTQPITRGRARAASRSVTVMGESEVTSRSGGGNEVVVAGWGGDAGMESLDAIPLEPFGMGEADGMGRV